MRLDAVLILALVILGGCTISPQKLCAPHVPGDWQYLGQNKELANQLGTSLPSAPYTTNKGKAVRSLQHVWYRGGEQQLLACTLARRAKDDCSVRTTVFQRLDNTWVKGPENAVLCDVLASARNH